MSRVIDLKSVNNIRDLKGLKCDGGIIKEGLLLRSAALNKLSDKDGNYLKNKYNLSLVIDLRTNQESMEKPNKIIDGVNNKHIAIFPDSVFGITREEKLHIKDYIDKIPDMKLLYKDMILNKEYAERFSKALKLVLNQRNGAVLWHCSAGKDRCGFLTILVLSILGVSKEDIIDDYLLSNVDARKEATLYGIASLFVSLNIKISKMVYDIYMVKEEYINILYETVEDNYGDFLTFIKKELKISNKEIEDFKNYVIQRQ